jgi:hypothetical protein
MALVEIATFPTRAEAEVAAAALRAHGIEAVMFEDALGSAYSFPLSGRGFPVMAPAAAKDQALETLASLSTAAPADSEE